MAVALLHFLLGSNLAFAGPFRGTQATAHLNSTPRSLPKYAVRMSLMDSIFGTGTSPGRCTYDNLTGRPKSFGKEAAKNALSGVVPAETEDGYALATFAGGCFWGIELLFQRVPGVVATCVGYTQGQVVQPTYAEVCTAKTGHTEAVQVVYDPKEVSYTQLCGALMGQLGRSMFLLNQVGNDRGPQYRHGIYPHTPEQRKEAVAFLSELQDKVGLQSKILTEIEDAQIFWPAEEYHQQYLQDGGRFGLAQSAEKGCQDTIRCYG